jgi:ribonuclease P protein component
VVHALRREPVLAAEQLPDQRVTSTSGSLVGFVVSRAVGTAVRRNRVRRRLRHLTRPHLDSLEHSTLVVVRALPPAAGAGVDLGEDLDAAWAAALAKLDREHGRARRQVLDAP